MDEVARALIIETRCADEAAASARAAAWPEARRRAFARALDASLKQGATPVLATDPNFPSAWRQLSGAPSGAWLLGAWRADEPRVAIVGSRAAPPRVCAAVRAYSASLCGDRVRVVSGAAVGVVNVGAHRGWWS